MSHGFCLSCYAYDFSTWGDCSVCGGKEMLRKCYGESCCYCKSDFNDLGAFLDSGQNQLENWSKTKPPLPNPPTGRPTFPSICLNLASSLARRSTCKRLQVGAVITTVDHRQVLAWGYNGNATGFTNGCDSDEPGKCGCLHAEINAIINCSASRETPKLIYLTDSPCAMCIKAIINLGGVKRATYARPYRASPFSMLVAAGIEVVRAEET